MPGKSKKIQGFDREVVPETGSTARALF